MSFCIMRMDKYFFCYFSLSSQAYLDSNQAYKPDLHTDFISTPTCALRQYTSIGKEWIQFKGN